MTPLNIIPQNITPHYPIQNFTPYQQQHNTQTTNTNDTKENMNNMMSMCSMMLMNKLM